MGKRLYVDMDGTLCQFRPVRRVETLLARGYFRKLPPQEAVVQAVRTLAADKSAPEIHILTSFLTDSLYAVQEKKGWLTEHLPEIPAERIIFTPCGVEKGCVAHWRSWDGEGRELHYGGLALGENDCLLDDYTKNLLAWTPPGRGIKLLNGINHSKGTWQGNTVSCLQSADSLAADIKKAAQGEHVRYPDAGYGQQKDAASCRCLPVKMQKALCSSTAGSIIHEAPMQGRGG
jgi:hypothetical protein